MKTPNNHCQETGRRYTRKEANRNLMRMLGNMIIYMNDNMMNE